MVAVRHVLASAATGDEDAETVIAWTDGFLLVDAGEPTPH
jgi:hypothetical protein